MNATAKILISIFSICLLFSFSAQAETAQLKINGDLMVHPDQVAGFLQLATDKIRSSPNWDWPELQFTKPYKTSWSQVQARGPFDMTFSTDGLKNQELGFELTWNDPTISVGQFQIDDTITRTVGGNTIIIHLAGQCNGMMLTIPAGQWKVKGRLGWTWNGTSVDVKWLDFAFSMNGAAVPMASLGQCAGPTGLQPALQQAIDAISHDQSWLQDVLRDGVMNWVENSLGSLQSELLKARTVTLKPGLDATWQPESLAGVPGGLVRVAGHLDLSKDSVVKSETVLERSYADSSLGSVQNSGFVLPKETLQALLNFTYKNGELQYRVTSDKVDAFQSLMQSRFMQFFVWPDLMAFAKNTIFYFDVATSAVPQLSQGVARSGQTGISYAVQAPLVVHQWAPAGNQYVPYVDFTTPMNGRLDAYVKDKNLVMQLTPNALNVSSVFRPEYGKVRSLSQRIATSLLGSRVESYLAGKPFSIALPEWQLGENMSLSISDVQVWKQSFRVPLQFKNSK